MSVSSSPGRSLRRASRAALVAVVTGGLAAAGLPALGAAAATPVAVAVTQPPSAQCPTGAVTWSAPVDGHWSDPAKWSTGAVPTSQEDVCITVTGAPYTVLVEHTQQARSLRVGAGGPRLLVQAGYFVSADLQVATDVVVSGELGLVTQHGGWAPVLDAGGTTRVTAAGTLRTIEGTGGLRHLRGDLLNEGVLALDQGADFDEAGATLVNTGTMTVAAGRTLAVPAGRSLVQRGGTLGNHGQVLLDGASLTYEGGGVTGAPLELHRSTMAFPATPPAPLSVLARYSNELVGDVPAGVSVKVLSGAYIDSGLRSTTGFTNSGTIELDTEHSGWWPRLSSGGQVVNAAGGVLRTLPGGGGSRAVDGSVRNLGTMDLQQGLEFDGAGAQLLNEGTVQVADGRRLHLPSGRSLVQRSGGLANAGEVFFDHSTFRYEGGAVTGNRMLLHGATLGFGGAVPPEPLRLTARYTTTLEGDVPAGTDLRVLSGAYVDSVLRSTPGFTNRGTIELDSEHSGWWPRLSSGGQVVNAPTGVIRTVPGGGGSRAVDASLLNRGRMDLQQGLVFDGSSAQLVNEGALEVAESRSLHVMPGRQLVQRAGSLSNAGEAFVEFAALRYEGGAVTGNRLLVHGSTLTFTGATPPVPLRITTRYATTLKGDVPAGVDLRVLSGAYVDSSLTSATALTNAGTIELATEHSSWSPQLVITDGGRLTHARGGTLRALGGGGGRTIQPGTTSGGVLDPQGDTALTFARDLVQGSSGAVDIRVRPNDADHVRVDGAATLGGALRLSTEPGYSPALGTTRRVLTAGGAMTGTFGGVSGAQLYDGKAYQVEYGAQHVDVTVVPAPAVVNEAPTGTLTAGGLGSGSTAVLGSRISAVVTGADVHDDVLTATVDWGDGVVEQPRELPFADAPAHRYTTVGDRTITVTVSDGVHAVQLTQLVHVTLSGPLAADAGPDHDLVAGDSALLDATGSTPAADITGYTWTLSDGRSFTGPLHSVPFDTPLDQPVTATLTVTAGGQTATDTTVIAVRPVPSVAGLRVAVTGPDGAPVQGARLLVLRADGSQAAAETGGDGTARLHGLADGDHTVYVLADGYRPDETTATVLGGTGDAAVQLVAGGIATAALESTPMTPEQAQDAGIDTSDPDNYNVYAFEIVLAFDGLEVPFSGHVAQGGGGSFVTSSSSTGGGTTIGGGGTGGGGGSCTATGCTYSSGGSTVQVQVKYVADTPTLLYMVIPGRAKWLKEFYDVRMAITNLGSPSFVLTGGQASLALPGAGLSLPPLAGAAQSATRSVPDIPGGGTEAVSWVLRGDAPGSYPLTADYTGTLDPVGAAVELTAVTEAPIRVWGLDAVEVTVDADTLAVEGAPYRVTARLRNATTGPDAATLYNVGLSFDEGQGFTYAPGQQRTWSAATLAPGQEITATLDVLPHFSGTLNLAQVVSADGGGSSKAGGAGTGTQPVTPQALTATSVPGGVDLEWAPVAGADYLLYALAEIDDPLGEPLMTLPAGQTTAQVRGLVDGTAQWYVLFTRQAGVAALTHAAVRATSGATPPQTPRPGLAVGDLVVAEGDASDVVHVPLTLTRPHGAPVAVKVTTANGTALAGKDFTAVSTTVTLDPGQTSTSVPVTVLGDELGELSEAFTVKAVTSAVTVEDGTGSVRLVEDDGPVFARIGDASAHEGSGQVLEFPVSLSRAPAPGQTISLALSTAAGTARTAAPADFTATTTVLAFGAGETAKTLVVPLVDDATGERNETMSARLAPSGRQPGVLVADASAVGTIIDDETPGAATVPAVSIGDALVLEGDSGQTTALLPVVLNKTAATDIAVTATTVAGTATATSDFVGLSKQLVTVPAGQTSTMLEVLVNGDEDAELDEALKVSLTLPAKNVVLGDAVGTLTIADEEGLPTLSLGDAAGHEPASGAEAGTLTFVARLSRPVPSGTTVARISTANGSALAGQDYTPLALQPLVWTSPGLEQQVKVPLLADALHEGPQTLALKLVAQRGVLLSDAAATGTVVDHQGPVTVGVSDADAVQEGGTAGFTLALSGPTDRSVAVKWATASGTARAGSDFTSAAGTVTFAAGETSKTVQVATLADTVADPLEQFTVKITPPKAVTATRLAGTGTILPG